MAGELAPGAPVPLGIFGGTFDPPHAGHIAAARAALRELGVGRLLVTVAGDPWQKSATRSVTAAEHRLAMTRAAFGDVVGVEVSDCEVRRGGPTYTIDTVRDLVGAAHDAASDAHPSTVYLGALYLVVGSHAAREVDTWHRATELADLVTLAVIHSAGDPPRVPSGWRAVGVPMVPVDVSSSRLRDALAGRHRGAPAADLPGLLRMLDNETLAYIDAHGLYMASARRAT